MLKYDTRSAEVRVIAPRWPISYDEPAAEQLLHISVLREPAAIVLFANGEVDVLTAGRPQAAVERHWKKLRTGPSSWI
jgi:hypothetical protein